MKILGIFLLAAIAAVAGHAATLQRTPPAAAVEIAKKKTESSVQCAGTTQKGARCKNRVAAGKGNYCHHHKKK
jgi:hypothetical protein